MIDCFDDSFGEFIKEDVFYCQIHLSVSLEYGSFISYCCGFFIIFFLILYNSHIELKRKGN